MNKHAVSIKWSDEDNGFIAIIPGIQGLSAFGETREEAILELKIAAEAYFRSLKKAGRPYPSEEKIISYSGQIRLRMPKTLHANLSNGAKDAGVSLNTYIINLLSERHVESNMINEIADLKRELEFMYSQLMQNENKVNQHIHKIEEGKDKFRDKKSKKN